MEVGPSATSRWLTRGEIILEAVRFTRVLGHSVEPRRQFASSDKRAEFTDSRGRLHEVSHHRFVHFHLYAAYFVPCRLGAVLAGFTSANQLVFIYEIIWQVAAS